MAEKLEAFDFREATRTRKSLYPWDEWLDGSIYRVVRGVDFKAQGRDGNDRTVESFGTMVRQYASKNGMSCRVNIIDQDTLVFQVFHKPEPTE